MLGGCVPATTKTLGEDLNGTSSLKIMMLRLASEQTTFIDITLFQNILFFEQNGLALEEFRALSLDPDKSQPICLGIHESQV